MAQSEQDYFIAFISSILDDRQPPEPPPNLDWEKLYRTSARHCLSNMVWYGILKLKPGHRPPQEIWEKFHKDHRIGLAKEALQQLTLEQILKTFEENRISCLPLKGSQIKCLYPRPDMRWMVDVDILIHTGQALQIKELMQGLGFTLKYRGENHDVYCKEPFLNVEIHRRLVSEKSPFSEYLSKTWDRARLETNCRYIYQLSREDLFIYLIIHLTKHFSNAGTGIRSFIDIYLYNRFFGDTMDWPYIWSELEKTGLREFAGNIMSLCSVWFQGAASSELYTEMADYIFSSGVYGNCKNLLLCSMISISGSEMSVGKVRQLYRLKLFFPGLLDMKSQYPVLGRFPFLLPFFWVLRGLNCLLFKRDLAFKILRKADSVSVEDLVKIRTFQEKAGLPKY